MILYFLMRNKDAIRQKKNKDAEEDAVCEEILRYGRAVLYSDVFRQASDETHHLHGTLRDHILNVCVVSVCLSRIRERKGQNIRKKDLIQAALCHDLGMIGRGKKYRSRKDSWRMHAEESVRIARELIPDLSDQAEDMIRTHMWPVTGKRPRSREGLILGEADKIASLADWGSWLTGKTFAEHVKEKLLKQ